MSKTPFPLPIALFAGSLILSACGGSEPTKASLAPEKSATTDRPNILLVIADDLGVDQLAAYGAPHPAPTPTIDTLAAEGMLFTKAWSHPVCSPTRSAIFTGRHSFRTGVGWAQVGPSGALGASEYSLSQALGELSIPRANIGKWHLGGGTHAPNDFGYDYYSGLIAGALPNYSRWPKTTNGETVTSTEYATTDNVNEAIDWVGQQTQPWFLWLAFNAPHTPFHKPPSHLHSSDHLSGKAKDIATNPGNYYRAMVEAMDTELGRLLGSMDQATRDNTIIVFLGDNGSPGQVVEAPFDPARAKGTLYEGGVHVPMIISGPAIRQKGSFNHQLVSDVDLFATILELAGGNLAQVPEGIAIDSYSLIPTLNNTAQAVRTYTFTESFQETELTADNTGKAIRNQRYKLIRFDSGRREFYDLDQDPEERHNLLGPRLNSTQRMALAALAQQMNQLLNSPAR